MAKVSGYLAETLTHLPENHVHFADYHVILVPPLLKKTRKNLVFCPQSIPLSPHSLCSHTFRIFGTRAYTTSKVS